MDTGTLTPEIKRLGEQLTAHLHVATRLKYMAWCFIKHGDFFTLLPSFYVSLRPLGVAILRAVAYPGCISATLTL
jgi:hypothetical protein